MKKNLILIAFTLTFFFLSTCASHGQTVKINGNDFVFEDVDCTRDEFEPYMMLHILRGDSIALDHTIFHSWTGCMNSAAEIGSYEIEDNNIVLYSYSTTTDIYPIVPYQYIKKTYTVDKEGHIILIEGKMFLDLSQSDEEEDESIPPMTPEEEEKAMKGYVDYMEQLYQATLVDGAEKENLIAEITGKLKTEIDKLAYESEDLKGMLEQ